MYCGFCKTDRHDVRVCAKRLEMRVGELEKAIGSALSSLSGVALTETAQTILRKALSPTRIVFRKVPVTNRPGEFNIVSNEPSGILDFTSYAGGLNETAADIIVTALQRYYDNGY